MQPSQKPSWEIVCKYPGSLTLVEEDNFEAQMLSCPLQFPSKTKLQLPTAVTGSRKHPYWPPSLPSFTSPLSDWGFVPPCPPIDCLHLNPCLRDSFRGIQTRITSIFQKLLFVCGIDSLKKKKIDGVPI